MEPDIPQPRVETKQKFLQYIVIDLLAAWETTACLYKQHPYMGCSPPQSFSLAVADPSYHACTPLNMEMEVLLLSHSGEEKVVGA
jgi:hypothetical protein